MRTRLSVADRSETLFEPQTWRVLESLKPAKDIEDIVSETLSRKARFFTETVSLKSLQGLVTFDSKVSTRLFTVIDIGAFLLLRMIEDTKSKVSKLYA